jgi:hypothetical protein
MSSVIVTKTGLNKENEMKVKTAELSGAALDWAVAKCEGITVTVWKGAVVDEWSNPVLYHDDRAQGGPIIEREKISIKYVREGWVATMTYHDKKYDGLEFSEEKGDTPLIAAMRCYVASKLGDEVDVPDELLS